MKTSKQKCLEMWKWLRDNPGKNKLDYRDYLINFGLGHEYEFCWACEEAEEDCKICPITWPTGICITYGSPYLIWEETVRNKDPFDKESCIKACEDIIELIKTTWKD